MPNPNIPKPDIYAQHVRKIAEYKDFSDAHYMRGTGTFKIVMRDLGSTMGIRYFENYEELTNWVNRHE